MRLMNRDRKTHLTRTQALLIAVVGSVVMSCTKGGGITDGGGGAAVGSGVVVITDTYPTSAGNTWTPITSAGRIYIKGLDLTVTGTCTRGIATIKVNEGAADYTEVGTCADDGSFTFNKVYTAITGEGDKTLHLTAYDASGLPISGATATQDVRIDNTAPAVPVVTLPATSPYSHNGAVGTYNITGTIVAGDAVKVTGPGGVVITPSGANWNYTATLTAGASLNFTFYAWDLAGNQSAGVTQTILWSPAVLMYASGVISGGPVTDGGTSYKMESSSDPMPAKATDGFSSYSVLTGFNYIINTVRGL